MRRKRAQPSKVTSDKSDLTTAAVPVSVPRPPPDASSLSTISLKPQWAINSKSSSSLSATKTPVVNGEASKNISNFANDDKRCGKLEVQIREDKSELNFSKYSSHSDEMVGSSDIDGSDVDFKFEKLPVLTADVRQRALQTINSVIEVRLNKF